MKTTFRVNVAFTRAVPRRDWQDQHQPPLHRPSSTTVLFQQQNKDFVFYMLFTKCQHNSTCIQSHTFDKSFAGKFTSDWLCPKGHVHQAKHAKQGERESVCVCVCLWWGGGGGYYSNSRCWVRSLEQDCALSTPAASTCSRDHQPKATARVS